MSQDTKLRYEVTIEPHPEWETAHFEGKELVGRFVCEGDAYGCARMKQSGLLIAAVYDRVRKKTLYRSPE